jgi:hypothetical protein
LLRAPEINHAIGCAKLETYVVSASAITGAEKLENNRTWFMIVGMGAFLMGREC